MSALSTQPYKGTRDYYPEDMALQRYIFTTWRTVALRYGFLEYGTPLLEPLDIYEAKSGDELANEQTYTFVDRGGRTVAIRPEMTPSVSRLVASKRQELAYPARLFSIANFMRYERPQRGREREFWQLNVDIFGDDGVAAEAEIIHMGADLLHQFGATNDMFTIRINNRQLINFIMAQYLSLSEQQSHALIKLLDRIRKIPEDAFTAQAEAIFGDTAESQMQKLRGLLEARTMADLPESVRESSAIEDTQNLFTILEHLGISNATFDMTLMRGLDYYTGTVFEVFDTDPENNRSLFGGGRYDGLVGLFGVQPISAVGMAPGLTTTELFLRSHHLLPTSWPGADLIIATIGNTVSGALSLASILRTRHIQVGVDGTDRKLDKKLKSASKLGVAHVLILGEEEVSHGRYTLKNIDSGQEQHLGIDELVASFKPSSDKA